MPFISILLAIVCLTHESTNYIEQDNAVFSLCTIILKHYWHRIILSNLINKMLSNIKIFSNNKILNNIKTVAHVKLTSFSVHCAHRLNFTIHFFNENDYDCEDIFCSGPACFMVS